MCVWSNLGREGVGVHAAHHIGAVSDETWEELNPEPTHRALFKHNKLQMKAAI